MATLAEPRPIASVSLTASDTDPHGFSQELGRSFEEYGFAIIADHGIPDELIARAEEKARAFFALPDEVKRKYHIPGGGGARGYTPFGIETAKGAQSHDLKEFWHVGRELPPGLVDELAHGLGIHPENGRGLLFGKSFEARQQEGLPGKRRDLADADLRRQVALDLLALSVNGK